MKIKQAWIPRELYALTSAAYGIMRDAGEEVPSDYGALLMITRLEKHELEARVEDGIAHQLDSGVCFNLTSSNLRINRRERNTPHGSATVFSTGHSLGVNKTGEYAEYIIVVRFVKKGAPIFKWKTKEGWLAAHPGHEGDLK